jgi:hypothetical protein
VKVGDTVTHVDYPAESGKIVAKVQNIFLVKWDNNSCSRHIKYALRSQKVKATE